MLRQVWQVGSLAVTLDVSTCDSRQVLGPGEWAELGEVVAAVEAWVARRQVPAGGIEG